MNKILSLLAIVIAIASSACVVVDNTPPRPFNGDYYGSAYYYVEELDYIYDQYGYEQTALCTGEVRFEGWFDATCDALIESQYTSAYLYCDYYDAFGGYYTYQESFGFPRGYITEGCAFGKAAATAQAKLGEDEMTIDPNTQPVVEDGQLHAVLGERTGKHLVSENLGKNTTAEDFLKQHGVLVRKRNTDKAIEKTVTTEQVTATQSN